MTCNPHAVALPFTQRNIERIQDDAYGIYGLWYNRICVYVGKAEKQPIKERLKRHFNDSHNSGIKDWLRAFSKDIVFAVKPINDKTKIHRAERRFISLYAPRTNKTK